MGGGGGRLWRSRVILCIVGKDEQVKENMLVVVCAISHVASGTYSS